MTKEKFATLWAYITNQEETSETIVSKIEKLKPENEDQLVNLAYQLHNLYSAYEDMFKEISETFENNIERSAGFHKNLLIRMKIAIPGIRPCVLKRDSYDLLGELMGFRHVFRHAYNYNLSPDKMNILRTKLLTNIKQVREDIANFKLFLKENYE